MARFLSSNGRISAHFHDIHLKFSTHAYFEVCFHFMLSKYEILKIDFHDVITHELYNKQDQPTVIRGMGFPGFVRHLINISSTLFLV